MSRLRTLLIATTLVAVALGPAMAFRYRLTRGRYPHAQWDGLLGRLERLRDVVREVVELSDTAKVAMRHYLMTTDEHFNAAARGNEPEAEGGIVQQDRRRKKRRSRRTLGVARIYTDHVARMKNPGLCRG